MQRSNHRRLNEARRVALDQGMAQKAERLADRLWRMRGRVFDSLTHVETWLFRIHDGTDAMMTIWVDPDMEDYWAITETNPRYSRDPMDLEMRICHPGHYPRRRDLHNVIVHESMHALDPTETTQLSLKKQLAYGWWAGADEEGYLSHQGEYMAIYNEILDAMVRLFAAMSKTHSRATRLSTLDEIVGFFAAGRLDAGHMSDRLARFFGRLSETRDYVEMLDDIRRYTPRAHRQFLQKLYTTADEIRASISNPGEGEAIRK